jgi:outer membrane protein OmpA-like peptidoglycan-associated protein
MMTSRFAASARGRRCVVVLVVGALGSRWSASARADDADVSLFHAAAPATGYFRGDGPRVVRTGELQAGFAFELGEQLLISRDPQTGEPVMDGEIVARRAALHLTAGYGLSDSLEVGVALAAALQAGDESRFRPALRQAALGDLRLYGKRTLLASGRWKSAATLEVSLPTASARAYFGEAGSAATALLIGGLEERSDGKGWSVTAQAGYRVREAAAVGDLEIDDEILGGIAGRYPIAEDRLWAQAEVYGAWGVQGKGNELERPVELLAGARLRVGKSWIAQAALGFGLTQGYGTAELRGVVSLGIAPGGPEPVRVARDWTPSDDDEPVFEEPGDATAPAEDPTELKLVGDRIVLPAAILFELGGDEIRPEGQEVLARVLEMWRANPSWVAMAVEGHTDLRGATRLNQELSERRATNVRAALIALGASAEALRAVGFGKSRPLTLGDGEADHARNRRVELVITQRQVEGSR